MGELTIDGEVFRVEVEGNPDFPAVLLSCSLGTDLTLFDAQMPALLEHFRVVRYDPRGHGRSTEAGAPYALERLGADALAILDQLGIGQTHVVGISMGGAVAQWLLVNAPERISRAVLANTSARIGTPDLWNTRIATVLCKGTGALARSTMERWFGAGFRAAAPDRVAAVETLFRATSAQGYAGCCAALRDADLREAIRVIDRPVLIVSGRDDPVTSEADLAAMMGAIAGARHVVLDSRHISNIEAEAAFNAATIGFLTAPAARVTGKTRVGKPPSRTAKLAPARRATTSAPRAKVAAATSKTARKAKPATGKVPAKRQAKQPAKARVATGKTSTTTRKTAGVARAGAAKTSPARRPVAKATAARKPSANTSATNTSATNTSATKTSAPKTSATETSVAKQTSAKQTTAKKTPAKKTAAKRPTARRRPTKPTRPGRRRT